MTCLEKTSVTHTIEWRYDVQTGHMTYVHIIIAYLWFRDAYKTFIQHATHWLWSFFLVFFSFFGGGARSGPTILDINVSFFNIVDMISASLSLLLLPLLFYEKCYHSHDFNHHYNPNYHCNNIHYLNVNIVFINSFITFITFIIVIIALSIIITIILFITALF